VGFETLLEHNDLGPAFTLSSLAGMALAVYLMQLTWHDAESRRDCVTVRHLRRIAHAAVALGFLWCLSFGLRKGWQPWPPILMLALAVDLQMFVRIMAIHFAQRAGERRERLTA
jgi:hypothetical protein